jgi:hypothetical protein
LISKAQADEFYVAMAPCRAALDIGAYGTAFALCQVVVEAIQSAAGIQNVYNVKVIEIGLCVFFKIFLLKGALCGSWSVLPIQRGYVLFEFADCSAGTCVCVFFFFCFVLFCWFFVFFFFVWFDVNFSRLLESRTACNGKRAIST